MPAFHPLSFSWGLNISFLWVLLYHYDGRAWLLLWHTRYIASAFFCRCLRFTFAGLSLSWEWNSFSQDKNQPQSTHRLKYKRGMLVPQPESQSSGPWSRTKQHILKTLTFSSSLAVHCAHCLNWNCAQCYHIVLGRKFLSRAVIHYCIF